MQKEREHIDLLDFTTIDGKVEYPNFPYNGVEGNMRQAVGLVIIRIGQCGGIEVLLGEHNSPRNQHKHNRWGWFGETRDEENDWGTFDTLFRLTAEELDRNLATFRFFTIQREQLFYTIILNEGDRALDSNMLVVYSDEDLSGPINPYGEIERTEYEGLDVLLSGQAVRPLREYTVSALQQLSDQGAFEIPKVPLRELVMPKKV